jgi:parvulin-like peptidyl-prolyl isomerase
MSEPVATFKGVVLLQVERLSPERTLEFDEVEERLRNHLQQQRGQERLVAWRTELRGAAQVDILDPALAPQPPPSPDS